MTEPKRRRDVSHPREVTLEVSKASGVGSVGGGVGGTAKLDAGVD